MATTEHRKHIAWHVVRAYRVEHGVELINRRISRLLRSSGVRGGVTCTAAYLAITTQHGSRQRLTLDLIRREFKANGLNQSKVADVTDVHT